MPNDGIIDFQVGDNSIESDEEQTNEQTNEQPPIIEGEPIVDLPIKPQEESGVEGDYNIGELYKFLNDSNIAPDIENIEDIKTIDDLSNILQRNRTETVAEQVQRQLESKTSAYKDLFNYLDKGGNINTFLEQYNNSYDSVNETMLKDNGVLQDKVIYDYYKNSTRWDDTMIKTQMSKLNDDEKIEMSKTMLNGLKQIEADNKATIITQQQESYQKQQQAQKELLGSYKEALNNMNEVGDLKLTPDNKKELENLMFNDVTYNKLNTDFEKYRMNLAILDMYGLLDDPGKITKIQSSNNKAYNFKNNKKSNVYKDEQISFTLLEPKKKQSSTIKPWGF